MEGSALTSTCSVKAHLTKKKKIMLVNYPFRNHSLSVKKRTMTFPHERDIEDVC